MKIKNISIWRGIALLLLVSIHGHIYAQKQNSNNKPHPVTDRFDVTAMECSTDSKMVEKALYRQKGVKEVKIEGSVVTVTYQPGKITREKIVTVIEQTGTCEDPKARVHKTTLLTP